MPSSVQELTPKTLLSPHAGWPSQQKVHTDIKEGLALSKRKKSKYSQRSRTR